MAFEGEERRPFPDFVDSAIEEANYYFGYGRYLKKNVDQFSADYEEWFKEHYERGQELVKEANAIKESLRVASNDIDALDKGWNKERADNPDWSDSERDAAEKIYDKKKLKAQKKFVGEAYRLVWLRNGMAEVLDYLELKPRRKYKRRPEEEPQFNG